MEGPVRRKPKNEYDAAASARVLSIARSYLENSDRLIYSYGGKTFLSGYDLYDRESDGRGNIDCSTFVLLVLSGLPYGRSPYATGSVRGLAPCPQAEMDLSCLRDLPERYIGIAERIGRPYLACPKGLDLDKAAALGIGMETLHREIRASGVGRRSALIAAQFLERGECYSDPACLQPGDLVFYRSARFFAGGKGDPPEESPITHVGIVCGDTEKMVNSSGYFSRERAQAEKLPAVSEAPVFGRRTPAFFARPKYFSAEDAGGSRL